VSRSQFGGGDLAQVFAVQKKDLAVAAFGIEPGERQFREGGFDDFLVMPHLDGEQAMRLEVIFGVGEDAAHDAQAVIAGCTEVPLVLGAEDLAVPFIDATEALARACVAACAAQDDKS